MAAKSRARRCAPSIPSSKVRVSLSLSPRAAKRLGAACVFEGMDKSEVGEWLINTHLAAYSVKADGPRIADPAGSASGGGIATPDDRRGDEGGINSPALSAA